MKKETLSIQPKQFPDTFGEKEGVISDQTSNHREQVQHLIENAESRDVIQKTFERRVNDSVDKLESVFHEEYGEKPKVIVVNKEQYLEICYGKNKEMEIEENGHIVIYGSEYDDLTAAYDPKRHCILLKEGVDINDFDLMHEILHGFQCNRYFDKQTEEFKFDIDVKDEDIKRLIIKSIIEGHADWVSAYILRNNEFAEERMLKLQENLDSREFDSAVKEWKQADRSNMNLWSLYMVPYLIGYAYFQKMGDPKSLKIPLKKFTSIDDLL